METITINRTELKKIVSEIIGDVLNENRDILDEAILEVLEDRGMLKAIEEGTKGDYVDFDNFKKELNERIVNSK